MKQRLFTAHYHLSMLLLYLGVRVGNIDGKWQLAIAKSALRLLLWMHAKGIVNSQLLYEFRCFWTEHDGLTPEEIAEEKLKIIAQFERQGMSIQY